MKEKTRRIPCAWYPVPGASLKHVDRAAHRHGLLHRHKRGVTEVYHRGRWFTYLMLNGTLYVRESLRVHRRSAELPASSFICEACGRVKHSRELVVIQAGVDIGSMQELMVCRECRNAGGIKRLSRRRRGLVVREV